MYQDVNRFWFDEISHAQWWKADVDFDRLIAARFGPMHRQAIHAELYEWRREPEGRLAEIIVLDQFSRNIYRGEPRAFAYDAIALILAQEAVAAGADLALNPEHRAFVYMPYMHSESREIHKVAEHLFETNCTPGNLDFERRHKVIIDRFGRYPHRNSILGRESTPEELAFLTGPGSSF